VNDRVKSNSKCGIKTKEERLYTKHREIEIVTGHVRGEGTKRREQVVHDKGTKMRKKESRDLISLCLRSEKIAWLVSHFFI